ncbi:MAG: type IV pilus biogenesis/stability protein PilW [Psychrobium sp.]
MIKPQYFALLAMIGMSGLSGCVTQEFVAGSDELVQERTVNKKEAAMARLKLALEYLKNGNTAQAKLNLERAEKLDDSLDGIYSSYAYFYQTVGEEELADKAYQQALDDFPNNFNTRNNYGAFLCDNRRYEEAEAQFVKAIESPLNTQTANSYENAGLCALRDEKWQRAKSHLSAVLRYESIRARSILGLAKADLELGLFDEAAQQLRNYRRIYSQTSESLWLAIQVEQKRGSVDIAKQLGRMLLQKYPNSAATKAYLAKEF